MDNLQRKRDEIEILGEIFKIDLCDIIGKELIEIDDVSKIPLSSIFSKRSITISYDHEDIRTSVYVPPGYPIFEPPIIDILGISNIKKDEMVERISNISQDYEGSEHLSVILQEIEDSLLALKEEDEMIISTDLPPHTFVISQNLVRVCVYFHHIRSKQKREGMRNASRELLIGGYIKIGDYDFLNKDFSFIFIRPSRSCNFGGV